MEDNAHPQLDFVRVGQDSRREARTHVPDLVDDLVAEKVRLSKRKKEIEKDLQALEINRRCGKGKILGSVRHSNKTQAFAELESSIHKQKKPLTNELTAIEERLQYIKARLVVTPRRDPHESKWEDRDHLQQKIYQVLLRIEKLLECWGNESI